VALTVRADVIRAIRERQVAEVRYDDDAMGRIVHPHVLYRTANGQEHVDAYQIEGPTHAGALPDWRLFTLAKIRRVEVLAERFSPAPGYNPGGPKYRHGVIARV
jgi:predicted DNA-binding transcriptional regulator YafY